MWKVAERADGGDRVARLEAVEVGGAGSGAAIQAGRGRADADVESQLPIHAGVGGHGEVAADGQRVFGMEVENALCLPDLGKGGVHGDFVERYFVVGGDVELKVVARPVIERRRAGLQFKNQFLDEGGDVVVADDAESVGGGELREAATAGGSEVEEDLPVVFAGLIGLQADAGRLTPGRTVGDVESPVVLGAFDERARNKTVGQMGVAVGADAVGGVEVAVGRAVDGVGLAFMVEADDVFFPQEAAGADFDPAVDRPALGGENVRSGRRIAADARRGQLPLDVVGGVLRSAGRGRE